MKDLQDECSYLVNIIKDNAWVRVWVRVKVLYEAHKEFESQTKTHF